MHDSGYRLIPLYRYRTKIVAWAKADPDAFDWFSQFRWHLSSGGYARRTIGHAGHEYMHRAVLGLATGDGVLADHINRDRLDNRLCNLRVADAVTNMQNSRRTGGSSRFRGVCWSKHKKRWRATVRYDGKQRHVGLFRDELAAALAVEAVRLRLMPYAMPDPALDEYRRAPG